MKAVFCKIGDLELAAYRLPSDGRIQVGVEGITGSVGTFVIKESEWESLCSVAADAAAAYQMGKDDLRRHIDSLPGPGVGDDPVAVANRWNGNSGTTEPDYDMNPEDTASFLAGRVIEMAARIVELETTAEQIAEWLDAHSDGVGRDTPANMARQIRAGKWKRADIDLRKASNQ